MGGEHGRKCLCNAIILSWGIKLLGATTSPPEGVREGGGREERGLDENGV